MYKYKAVVEAVEAAFVALLALVYNTYLYQDENKVGIKVMRQFSLNFFKMYPLACKCTVAV